MKSVDALFSARFQRFLPVSKRSKNDDICLSLPTTTSTKSLPVSARPLSRAAFCHQPWPFVAHWCPLSPHVVNCSLLSSFAEFMCISESLLRYAYTTHDDLNLKIVAAQLWRKSCVVYA